MTIIRWLGLSAFLGFIFAMTRRLPAEVFIDPWAMLMVACGTHAVLLFGTAAKSWKMAMRPCSHQQN